VKRLGLGAKGLGFRVQCLQFKRKSLMFGVYSLQYRG